MIAITADSKPVYDAFGSGDYWGCNEWITWHKELLKKNKREDADRIWAEAWMAGVSKASGGKGTAPGSGYVFDSVPLDCRTFNSVFKTYVLKYPVLNDAVFSGVLGSTAGRTLSAGVGIVKGITDGASNASDGLSKFSAMLKWLVPLILILTIAAIGFYVYVKFIKEK